MRKSLAAPTSWEERFALYHRSFPDWSQSEWGFYVPRRRDPTGRKKWIYGAAPVVWTPDQVEIFRHAFTLDDDGFLPYRNYWILDVAQSGKSLLGAALCQWSGMFHERDAEVQLIANSKRQAEMRVYQALLNSLQIHPHRAEIVDMTREMVVFLFTGNRLIPYPFNPDTVPGGTAVLREMDELHAMEGEKAKDYIAEMKPTPALDISYRVVTSYPPHEDSDGPLNTFLKEHFTDDDQPRAHLEPVPGLEHQPCWRTGDHFIYWNHDPLRYPWHTQKFLDDLRADPTVTESRFERIWHARRTSRDEAFMPLRLWDACEDEDWHPLGPGDRNIPLVIGLDLMGGKLHSDCATAIARGLNVTTGRYELFKHVIWDPRQIKDPNFDYNLAAEEWILDLHRTQKVLGVYYDPTQFVGSANRLRRAGVLMFEHTQNNMRIEGDTYYRQLILNHKLRNYPMELVRSPQGYVMDIRQHVARAIARSDQDGNIRIVKKTESQRIDAAVADSMCCFGVLKQTHMFEYWARQPKVPVPSQATHYVDPALEYFRIGIG